MAPPNSKQYRLPIFTPVSYRNLPPSASLEKAGANSPARARLDPAVVRALVMGAGTLPAFPLRSHGLDSYPQSDKEFREHGGPR